MNDAASFIPTSSSAQRTLAEQALAELYERIMSGVLPPGSPLRLQEIAEDLGMSLSPVREGLRRLETIGLVEIASHRGARVRNVSVDDFEDTMRTRLALEVLAIRMAAEHFAEVNILEARSALDAHIGFENSGDRLAARKAHTRFHFALYGAAGSKWLLRCIEPVWENSERYRFASTPNAERIRQSDLEHEAILDACVRHDVEAAANSLSQHVERASGRMRQTLAERLALRPVEVSS